MALSSADVRTLIQKKRNGGEHSRAEIAALIGSYDAGDVGEGPLAAWLMAVCLRGMSLAETAALTDVMAHSGTTITWPRSQRIVDKHSTGGVGDAVSLIAVPLAAACGLRVAKLSGRALGHTGGTIDKLECIPGLRTDLSVAEFKARVMSIGCAIAAASAELAPADKKLYALRDRTATVDSIPLIAASVMSKKIAGGADTIVLDVKVGAGAFMRSLDEARTLGETMAQVGGRLRRTVRVLLTDMNAPVADSIGDALELDEALSVLEAPRQSRLREAACLVAGAMLAAAGIEQDGDGLERALTSALEDGSALTRFRELVRAQNGRLDAFDRTFPAPVPVKAKRSGFVQSVDARALGEFVARAKSELPAQAAARTGLRLRKQVGSAVARGDTLLDLFGMQPAEAQTEELQAMLPVGAEQKSPPPLLLGQIGA
jgi:pyrimidine-nucleoside phosphorylase